MYRLVGLALVLCLTGLLGFGLLTRPRPIPPVDTVGRSADLQAGQSLFYAGGCASCHAAPGTKGEAKLTLTGGLNLKTPFGTFVVPNISPDRIAGIGDWSLTDFVNAMKLGLSPKGRHYYPRLPFRILPTNDEC